VSVVLFAKAIKAQYIYIYSALRWHFLICFGGLLTHICYCVNFLTVMKTLNDQTVMRSMIIKVVNVDWFKADFIFYFFIKLV
jgi:hypothetical protein